MSRICYALLLLAIGAIACSQPSAEPQQGTIQRDTPSAIQNVADAPTPAPTAAAGPVPGSTAVSDVPSPTPTATAAHDPQPTTMATYTPRPPPTPAATEVSLSLEDYARGEAFLENFKSISFEASLELSSRISYCECPVTANAKGMADDQRRKPDVRTNRDGRACREVD